MPNSDALPSMQEQEVTNGRNRLEIIRFSSRESRRQAIQALLECGKFEGSTSDPNVWSVRTDVVRALLQANVPFEWLTRNLP